MIVGKEGQPRSGKSYETVKLDILEALKVKRRVYARINGLDHAAIAAHMGMDVEEVRAHLIVMDDDNVKEWLVCETAADGALQFPHIAIGSLVVVDEVHEYWPVGRAELHKPTADFFAKHGHIGLDVVLMSQDFKEVHRSVIRRMQRKNLYVKLDALGKDSSYSVRMYTASSAGKFELMGSEKRDYDPAIYPLYHGIQPGVETNAVYKTGSKTLWQTARTPAIFVSLALIVGLFFIGRFFMGGGMAKDVKKPVAASAEAKPQKPQFPDAPPPVAVVTRGVTAPPQPAVVVPPVKVQPPGIQYVLDVQKTARARYGGAFQGRHLLEFRGPAGQVMERLTSDQFRALGWAIEPAAFGVIATYQDLTIIFTSWPIDLPGEQSDQTAQRITAAGAPVASASESQPHPGASGDATAAAILKAPLVPRYGDIGARDITPADGGTVSM